MRSGAKGHARSLRRPALGGLLLVACTASTPLPVDPHWSTARPIPQPLQEMHGAVLDGKIYIAGGFDRGGQPTGRAYRYDPAADTWERIADLPVPRHHMPLAVAHDTLYAVGGLSGLDFRAEGTLWMYRVDANTWEARAPLPTPRGASAVATVQGNLIVVGGSGADGTLVATCAVYDPTTDTWRGAAPIPTPRDHLAAQEVHGIVYAIGGRPLDPNRNYDVVEAYDAVSDGWTMRAPMPSRRGGLGAAVLDGTIHAFGGETGTAVFADHDIYDPAVDRWTSAAPLPTARHGLAVAVLNGKIYTIGGGPRAGLAQTDVVEVFTP